MLDNKSLLVVQFFLEVNYNSLIVLLDVRFICFWGYKIKQRLMENIITGVVDKNLFLKAPHCFRR